jgi:hypothetical protein
MTGGCDVRQAREELNSRKRARREANKGAEGQEG